MAWFAWQSALLIVPAFILGCLVGYWYWRIQYRKAAFTESEAVTVISRRHERTITEKDAEIDRLQSLLVGGAGVAAASDDADTDDDAPGAAAVGVGVGAGEGDDAAPATDSTTDADDTSHHSTTANSTPADSTPADSTTHVVARTVDTAADDTPVVTAHDTDGALGGTPEPAGSTDAPDGGPVTVVNLPRETDLPAETVVDVTDGAVTGTDPEAVAHAVAQLPTQSTGEGAVIDLASLESATDASLESATDDPTQVGDVAPEPAARPAGAGSPTSDDSAPAVAAGLLAAAGNDRDDTPATADPASDDSSEDDLERIEGIGPRIASALRTAGIRSFRRLADADVPTLQAALEAAGLRFAPSLPTWSRQARFLADGDEVGFIKLTESLVAGREPGRSR